MRKVLAITVALMIAAIVLMPALGFTNQAAGNQSYSAKSGEKVGFSFTTGAPAHNLTEETLANKYSFKAAAVQSTRMPYSFQTGTATPYSVKLVGVENAVAEGMKNVKPAAKLGSMNKMEEAEPVAAPTTVEAPVEAAVVEPKFVIEGMLFNDTNGNGTMDSDEAGLASWTMNLEQAGTVINSTATAADGKFAFTDLAAGEYNVSEVLVEGWNIIAPAEGKSALTIVDASVTNLVFANQFMPTVAVPEVVMPVVAENLTAPVNNTELVNSTAMPQ
jgi:hypothetical protein